MHITCILLYVPVTLIFFLIQKAPIDDFFMEANSSRGTLKINFSSIYNQKPVDMTLA